MQHFVPRISLPSTGGFGWVYVKGGMLLEEGKEKRGPLSQAHSTHQLPYKSITPDRLWVLWYLDNKIQSKLIYLGLGNKLLCSKYGKWGESEDYIEKQCFEVTSLWRYFTVNDASSMGFDRQVLTLKKWRLENIQLSYHTVLLSPHVSSFVSPFFTYSHKEISPYNIWLVCFQYL